MKWKVLCSLLLIVVEGHSQSEWRTLLDSAKVLWYQDFDKTQLLVDRIEGLIPISQSEFLPELWQCKDIRIQSCVAFSRIQQRKAYLDEAEVFLEANRQALGDRFKNFHSNFRLSKAQYLVAIGDYEQALNLFVENQRELQQLPKSDEVCESLFIHSNEIAGILIAKGDYEAAINERLAGIPYFECGPPSSPSLIYRNIAQAYSAKGDLKNAISYLSRAEQAVQLQLRLEPQEGYRIAISVYELMSSYYNATGKTDSARLSISKALPLLAYTSVSNEFRGRIHFSLGELYALEKRYGEALESFQKAETYFEHAEHKDYLSELYTAMSSVYQQQGKLQQALTFCRQAMHQLVTDFQPDAFGNPRLYQVRSKKLLFNALVQKSSLEEQASHAQNDTKLLQRSFSTSLLAIALLDSISNELSLDQDRMVLSDQSYRAYESGIRLSDKLFKTLGDTAYMDRAFALMEKSKSVLLLENLRMVNRFSGVQPEWLERERALKAEVLLTEQELFEGNGDASVLQAVRERYAQLKHAQKQLMDQIKAEAPDYYALRFDRSTVSPEVVQQQLLQPGEALIEFFVGDSLLAVSGLSKNRRYWNVAPLPPNFASKINRLRALLTLPEGPVPGEEFKQLTDDVYQYALDACITALSAEAQRLIIVPDGLLGYIPFEVLQRRKDNAPLGTRFQVRYAHSATYLTEQMHPATRATKKLFAGFVASGDVRGVNNSLTALPGALSEVKSIVRELKSGFSLYERATVTDFKNHASEYTLLHLAMHSLLNDKNPMLSSLVFTPDSTDTDGQMTALELYGIMLKAELAVLSACNTGVGELHRGEGLMSFSRAFAYAGVPSLVISLWKVPDKATEKLMTRFYAHLKDGLPKDEALQKARLDFMAQNPEMRHPYFWAGFVLNGNAHPVSFPVPVQQYIVFLLSLMAIAGLAIFRKKVVAISQRYFSKAA